MATDKYQGFETNRFYGVFGSDGDGAPIVIGLDAGEALDAIIRKVAEDDGIEIGDAHLVVDSKLDHGDYFVAPIALRGAFKNDGEHEGSKPEAWWIDEAQR